MIVIYTGDVERSRVREEYDIGAAKISIEPAFLSELDGEGIFRRLEEKTGRNCELTDEELMEFIILPLSFRKREEKERMIRKTAERIRRVLDMTKVERMIREEIWADFTKELEEGRQELEKVSREKEKERQEKEKERRGREKEKRKREKERREYEGRLKKERQRREEEKQQMIKEIVCRMIKNGESTADIIAAIPEYTYEETEAMRKKLEEECGIVF